MVFMPSDIARVTAAVNLFALVPAMKPEVAFAKMALW